MNRVSRQASESVPPTRPAFPVFTVFGILVLAILVAITLVRKHRDDVGPPPPSTAVEGDASQPAGEEVADQAVAPSGEAVGVRPQVRPAHARPESAPGAAGPGSVAAQQLIGQLWQLQIADGKLTPQQGQQIQQNLRQLVAQGAAALPGIREFQDKNEDLPFGDNASKFAGVPSLRAGLIDALRQIGGPEAVAASRQVLQSTADPLEISLLARNLEEAAPGQYRQETLDTARQALAQVAAGNVEVKDVGPLFQVLQTYGDANIAAELQKLAPQWNYYATMALAGLPDGAGIASLAELARQPPAAETGRYNKLPVQMLAQLSSQYPEASSDLMDMARQGQIPESAWRAVAAGLGGNQYQFARQLPQNTFPSGSTTEAGSSTIGGKSETFYSLPLGADGSSPDVSLRLSIIDQLLSTTSGNPAAVEALNQARARLSGSTAGK